MKKNEAWEFFKQQRQLCFIFMFVMLPLFAFIVFCIPPAMSTDDWRSYVLLGVMFVLNALLNMYSLWGDYRTYKHRCRGGT